MSGGCAALLVQVLHVVVVVVEGHAAALPRRAFDGVCERVLLGVVEGVGVEAAATTGVALGRDCVDGGGVRRRQTLPLLLLVIRNHVLQLH